MKYIIIFIAVMSFLSCCKKEELPSICDDLGYNENPKKFEEGFYMNGIFNGKNWKADNAGYRLDTKGMGFGNFNECGLVKYSCSINNIKIDNSKQTITDAFLFFNYGQIDEIVTSQDYDSLVVSQDFENYIIFDYVTPDTSIVEGRFQLHLTKRWCFEYNNGTLEGCDSPPDYLGGEPKDIIITNGRFRLKREH